LLPVFGGIFYLVFGGNSFGRSERKRLQWIDEITSETLEGQASVIKAMGQEDPQAANQSTYIQDNAPYPVYENVETVYYPIGEEKFQAMLEALRSAKKFIFMEYFIIEEGQMWDEILSVLEEKAGEGVDVRLIYDDFGCLFTLSYRYDRHLEAIGIKCLRFNPLVPVLSAKFNTRDHRKITVVDGLIAFTGGINLSDEYINVRQRFGHWKDMGIRIQGEAVWNFTVMFLSLWNAVKEEESDFSAFKASPERFAQIPANGYVQPFSDTPLDKEAVGQNVYLNMINKAKDYVYITSPYLVIDDKMTTALCNAAKSGVDVRIITPHIPDKWYVHETSRSFYPKLIDSGIRIFEYTPGFMHGKTFVADDVYAVVGSINMDFRSLFLHFECGVWMCRTSSVLSVKEDFLTTQAKCLEIDKKFFEEMGLWRGLLSLVLRLFAPLL